MKDETGPAGPIDLSQEPDFLLGSLQISPSTREVIRAGERGSLEPKALQVLVALHQAGGRVVSRDALIARCWEGRIVGEDAINRVIGRLRRLSEADDGKSFVIETIPRVGFRLLQPADQAPAASDILADPMPVTPVEPPRQEIAPPMPPPVTAEPSHSRKGQWIAGVALLLLAAIAVTAWELWPAPQLAVESSRPFIATLAPEDYPDFSPNGAMLAYTSGSPRKIFVRNLGGGEGVKVTNDAYDDISPSWSSDGARLAYVAVNPGEPCRIMVVTVPAGEAREAGRCASAETSSLAWQPGTSLIYFAERVGLKGDAIFQLDLDSGARRTIVQENAIRNLISNLRSSPDGKWLAYLLVNQNIMIRDLASGKEQRLGFIASGSSSRSLAWSDDSKNLLASVSTGMGGAITAYPVSGQAPYRLYTTAMHIGHLAAGKGVIALETDTSRANLARPGANSGAEPDVVDAANGLTWSPSFAPDGTLAFLSNRSGTNAVWIMRPGGAPQQLFDGGFSPLYRVRFSPDGSRMAVVNETMSQTTIRIMTIKGATLTSFDMPSLGLGLPNWTPDGKALLIFDRKSLRTFRVPVDDPGRRSPFSPPHWVGITIRPDGIFATRADKPGIWRIDGAIAQINNTYPAFYEPPLAFRGSDVLVPDFSAEGAPRIMAQPVGGGAATLAGYAPGAGNDSDFQTDLAVNPKTGEILYTARVARDTNIDLLTLAKH